MNEWERADRGGRNEQNGWRFESVAVLFLSLAPSLPLALALTRSLHTFAGPMQCNPMAIQRVFQDH